MKKIILISITLLVLNLPILSNGGGEILPIAEIDCFYLRSLYNVADTVPDFEKKMDIDLDYYINLLEKQIKIIEHKIDTKESKWSDRNLQGKMIISGLFAIGMSYLIYIIGYELWTGKFSGITIPYNSINLPSLKFTEAEIKKLDLVEVKKITITYQKPKYNFMKKWEKQWIIHQLNNLSSTDQEKLNYYARKEAIWNAKMLVTIFSSSLLLTLSAILYQPLYEAINHQKNLQKQLKYTQNLYHRLLQEKVSRTKHFS